MAFAYGNVATVQADNVSGTLTDISAYVSSASMSIERDSTDLPRLGGNQTAKLVGPPGTTFELEGWYDPTLAAIFAVWQLEANQVARSFEYGPQGSAGSAEKYTAEVFLESYEAETSADDAGSWSATLMVDVGGVTRGTF